MERLRTVKLYRLLYPLDYTTVPYDEEDHADHYKLARKIEKALNSMCTGTQHYAVLLVINKALHIKVTQKDTVKDLCNNLRRVYRDYHSRRPRSPRRNPIDELERSMREEHMAVRRLEKDLVDRDMLEETMLMSMPLPILPEEELVVEEELPVHSSSRLPTMSSPRLPAVRSPTMSSPSMSPRGSPRLSSPPTRLPTMSAADMEAMNRRSGMSFSQSPPATDRHFPLPTMYADMEEMEAMNRRSGMSQSPPDSPSMNELPPVPKSPSASPRAW